MTHILNDLSDASLATAVKENLFAFFQSLGQSAAATVTNGKEGFRWRTSFAHAWFNGILVKRPPGKDAGQIVEQTRGYFESAGVSNYSWWLAPDLAPDEWAAQLRPFGFRYNNSTPGMAIDLEDLPPQIQSPLVIRQVRDPHFLAEWARIFVRGYGLPEAVGPRFSTLLQGLGTDLPLRHYLGFLDDEPVATSTLFLGAGTAGIYNVATEADARGRGIGSAMTLAPLLEARDLGYRAGVLQSSQMGYNVYRRLGFQRVCQVDQWLAH